MNFMFNSTESPSSIEGNSPFYPGTPAATSFVYPVGPFSDSGHELVVTAAPTPTPSPTPTPTPTPTPSPTPTTGPPVTVSDVRVVENRKHQVTSIVVDFSGGVNAIEADSVAVYTLTAAGKKGSFTARNAAHLKLRSAAYDAAIDEVKLTPRTPFAPTKPVELTINGQAPGGLQDSAGDLIDGNDDGHDGDDGVFVIGRTGVMRE